MVYCVIAVVVIFLVLVFTVIYLNEKNKELRRKSKEKEEFALGAIKELNKLKEEMQIKQEERSDAEAKIESLHTGNDVANAIDRLSKH